MPTLNEFVTRLLDILVKPSSEASPEIAEEAVRVEADSREGAPPSAGA
jgi:hypothetical protein